MKTIVFTSDTHNWLLKGFFHQWKRYAERKTNELFSSDFLAVEVAGFTRPEGLPDNVSFYSIGKFEDYPVHRWSDAVIKYLTGIKDELVLILLEDYWMLRPVNRNIIFGAYGFMMDNPNVARFDLAADRMFAQSARYAGAYGAFDLCEAKGAYALSFQASIYRREMLLEMMKPGETPWQAELEGSARLNRSPYRVVGTYNWPINYFIAVNKGMIDRTGSWMYPARTLTGGDWKELDTLGYTREPEAQHAG